MVSRSSFGLDWRLPLYQEYLFYFYTCRNYSEIIRFRRGGGDLKRLLLRNGLALELAGNPKFALIVFREIWQSKAYLRHYQGPIPQIVVDVGAHLGFFTVQAATLWPQAPVVAYEPDPTNFEALKRNITANNLRNVSDYGYAVCARRGTINLNVTEQAESHSIYNRVNGGTVKRVITVPAITLRDIIGQFDGKMIDFLKIDCEGCEFELLNSAIDIIRSHVRYLALEYHGGLGYSVQEALINPLQATGFMVHVEPQLRGQNGMIMAQNVI